MTSNETATKSDSPWWLAFYENPLFITYLDCAHAEDLPDILAFIHRHVDITSGVRVFDQCCGVGSVSLPLAEQGALIEGVDLSAVFIKEALKRRDLAGLQTKANYSTGDATVYTTKDKCDLAINMYTSFGYGDDEFNLSMLKRVRESLKPGGKLILDYPNMYSIIGTFRKQIFKTLDTTTGTITVTRSSRIDHKSGKLLQHWEFIEPDGKRSGNDTSLTIYLPHQICELLVKAGFDKDIQLYGGFDSSPLSGESIRCIALAKA